MSEWTCINSFFFHLQWNSWSWRCIFVPLLLQYSFPFYTVITLSFSCPSPQNYRQEAVSKADVLKQGLFPHSPCTDTRVRENRDWLAWANNNIVFNLDIITCKMSRRNSRAPLFPSVSFSRVQWWGVSFRNPNPERDVEVPQYLDKMMRKT